MATKKSTITECDGFSIFINPVMTTHLEGGPKITSIFQCIVVKKDDGKWGFDATDIMDIQIIEMMGVEITKFENLKAAIQKFKEMGIDLYDVVQKEFDEIIKGYTAEQFVLEQTGLKL